MLLTPLSRAARDLNIEWYVRTHRRNYSDICTNGNNRSRLVTMMKNLTT